jgi:hypothetical protein
MSQATPAEAPPAEWSSVIITVIKPEAVAEYEAIQKEVTAAYKKAGVRSRTVLQTMFGNALEYISVTPIAKFAELDGTMPLDKALGTEGRVKLLRRVGALVVSRQRLASLANPELSIRTPGEPLPYAQVTTYTLAPGKLPEFQSYMRDDFLPMARKGGITNLWVSRPIFGGESMQRVVVRPMKMLGEIDEGPLARRVLGAEGAQKLGAKTAGMFQSVQTRIVRYRADLSYGPEPTRVSSR